MDIQQVFLRYLLTPLLVFVSAIVLTLFNKKNAVLSNKKLIIAVLLSALVLALPGLFGFIGFDFMPWGYLLSQLYALGIGILAVYLLSKLDQDLIHKRKIFLFFAALIIVGFGMYLYKLAFDWLSPITMGWWAATSIFLFFIPMLFWWSYIALLSIPTEINKMWAYPIRPLDINLDHLDFDKLLVLELELYKNSQDVEPLKVKVKAPENMNFGTWFHKFIDDYNLKFPANPVVFKENGGQSFKWIFFVKKSFFRRHHYIDPDLDIVHNKVTEKMTIHAKRVTEN